METIYKESNYLRKLPGDIDNFKSKYREFIPELNTILYYSSFEIEVYENNIFRLKNYAVYKPFNTRWIRRPDYTSYDEYGLVIYWPAILLTNDINSIEEYKGLDKVLIPDLRLLNELITERIPPKRFETVESNTNSNNIFLNLFLKKKDKDPKTIAALDNATKVNELINGPDIKDEPAVPKYREENITKILTDTDILNMCVELPSIPINESSINLYIEGIPQKFGYDYILVNNNKLSWNPDILVHNNYKLKNLLITGIELTIKYLII